MIMICPKCDGFLDGLLAVTWGNGKQLSSLMPFICTLCASILLYDADDGTLMDPDVVKEMTGIDAVAAMMKNSFGLWQAIEKERARVLALPGRRPVKTRSKETLQ